MLSKILARSMALQQNPVFVERWIHMLSHEVRWLRLQNERLSLPKVQSRVLHLIETEGCEGRYTLKCTLKQLAQELAVTHEALYRALAELEKAGTLQRIGNLLCLIRGVSE